MSEKKNSWDDKPVDVSTEVNFIWSVATLLHSVSYKDADHRDVILPMTVLRRLECALSPTKEKVVKYAKYHGVRPHGTRIAELRRERTAIESAQLVTKMDAGETRRIKRSAFIGTDALID